jgi:outer membrane immunogenic protein
MRAQKIVSASFAMMLAGVLSAKAADLKPRLLKAPPAPIGYSWTGCHIGIEGGGAWGTSRHTQADPARPNFGLPLTDNFNVTGAMLGGTAGCDFQFSQWVLGAEGDLSWTNKKGSSHLIPPFNPAANTFETSEKWLDTLRARFGVAWDRWLLFGTGGLAIANETVDLCSPLALSCGSASQNVYGWTLGAGVEYAFSSNWSLKLEYLYVDLGKSHFPEILAPAVAGGLGFFQGRDVTLTNQIVRVGLNHKLDWFGHLMVKN